MSGGGALVNLLGLFRELWCSVLIISLIFCMATGMYTKIMELVVLNPKFCDFSRFSR